MKSVISLKSIYFSIIKDVKVKKNNTTFAEKCNENIDTHKGIFIDVFPYDNVPKPVSFLEKVEDCDRIFNEQLSKCGVTYFDYYLLHNINRRSLKIANDLNCFQFMHNLPYFFHLYTIQL